jgi:hypothetical protein
MMASATTEVTMMSQIGQPAASMIDNTCEMLLRKSRRHFSPRSAIPQGLGGLAGASHKPPAEAVEAIGKDLFARATRQARGLSLSCVRCVANHPQRLWITLWRSFRGRFQVALPKGFFFFCSKFERWHFVFSHQ